MSPKTDPSDEIDPFSYLGSTLGNAYFSGVGLDVLFEAVCDTHNQIGNRFEKLDKTVSAAIDAKDWFDALVKKK